MATAQALLDDKLQSALDAIGNDPATGTQAQSGGSNVDGLLHEFYVAKKGRAYFDKRADKAKDVLLQNGFLDDMPEEGGKAVGVQGDHFQLTLQVNNGSLALNKTKLENYLMTKLKMKREDVINLIHDCSDKRAGAKIIDAIPLN